MAGTADGSIIAIIISHHISTSAPNGGVPAPMPSGMPPPATMNHQLSTASSATPTRTINRSRRSNRLVKSGADDTVAGKMQVRQLRVFVGDLDIHRTAGCAAARAADLRDLIFKAVREADLRARLLAGRLVADRF